MARLVAVEGFTVKMLLTPLLRPLALAVSCLLVPARSIRKPVNETVPLPAPVPMSNDVVPCMGPVPLLRLNVTFRLPGNPAVELLPKGSWVLITGCVPKAEPAAALPGWLVNARALAAAGLMAIAVDGALARLPLLNKRVMFVATLCDKFVNVTTPSAAVLLVAPCNVPLPALRLAVMTVELSPLPLAALRRFPNWSRTWMTGCGAKATPAMAVGGGWLWMTRLFAAPAISRNAPRLALADRPTTLAVPLLERLPLVPPDGSEPDTGRTRTFCQVNLQVTPLRLVLVTVN